MVQPPAPPPPVVTTPPAKPSVSAPKRRHRLRWTVLSISAVLVVAIIIGGWIFYRAIAVINTKKLDGSNRKLSFFEQLTHLVTQKDNPLQGEAEDRVNILLLGIGGPGHDGPYLTDTIMVASFQPSTKQVAMLSIPRDLVVNIPGYDYRKINNVLSFGRDQDYPGGGEALVVKVVGDLLDLPIQYYARVDFQGFESVIDELGGISVEVATAFTDAEYPTENYGYQTIRFKAGSQTMDGATALKFARSRHGNNGEGSDFARAARQQKIILATKDKALSLGTLANPVKISDILGVIGEHHQTNMEAWEMVRLAQLAGDTKNDQITTKVLDNSVNGLLKQGTGLGGAYILVPKSDTYDDIRFLANHIFLVGQAEREGANILVANATGKAGLADAAAKTLAAFGLTADETITIRTANVEQTTVLDYAQGRYPKTAELLARYAHARGQISLATWETETDDQSLRQALETAAATNQNVNVGSSAQRIDMVLILGTDQTTSPATAASRSRS